MDKELDQIQREIEEAKRRVADEVDRLIRIANEEADRRLREKKRRGRNR